MVSLNPVVSSQPPNFGIGETFSFLGVENNQGRSLFAKATYVVNESIKTSFVDGPNIDAFGRLRMSTPYTLFDSKSLHSKQSLFWSNALSGTGTVGYTGSTDSSITLSASSNGSFAIMQTSQRFSYQPGKSQLVLFTGILEPTSNSIKRMGLFTSLSATPYTPSCGLYFETQTDSPSSIAVVQNNDGNLVPSVSALRSDWNIDKLDGTGPSGKVLTLSAANIFLVDYEWLGVGRVRFGVVIDGHVCYCHQINNAGHVLGVYLKTPNLPARAEIRQVGAGTCSMKKICFSVMSEGGSEFTGITRSIDTPKLTIAADSRKAVLGLRLQADRIDSTNELMNAATIMLTQGNATNAAHKYEIVLNPSGTNYFGVSGGTWQSVASDSNFEYWSCDAGGNSAFGGTSIVTGYSSTGTAINLTGIRFEKLLRSGCSVTGQRDELYLVLTPLESNGGAFGSLTFIEGD